MGVSLQERRDASMSQLPFGVMVRDARLAIGMKQVTLGHRVKLEQATISRIETGQISPTIEMAERIMCALGKTLVLSAADRGE